MKSIFALIAAFASLLLSSKSREADLVKEIADRNTIIDGQNTTIANNHAAMDAAVAGQAQLDATALQDSKDAQAASLQSQQAAEASLAALQAQLNDAGTQADALLAQVNTDPAIPVTVTPEPASVGGGTVVHDTTAPQNDAPAPVATPAPAGDAAPPPVVAPAAAASGDTPTPPPPAAGDGTGTAG